jgi:uncharacterized protein YfaS (alpha-2-macroglobulin family)
MKIKLSLLFVLLSFSLYAGQARSFRPINHNQPELTMKSTVPDYEKEWAKVDSLIEKGLPQSALEVVAFIYTDSKAKNNAPQFLKAIIYKLRLESDYQEDYLVRSIDSLKKELTTSKGNISAILHSMLAEMYWSYYQSNRYNFLNRTQTTAFKQEDIHTWDARKIIREVIEHYTASLVDPASLKTIDLKNFDPILYVYDGSIKFRPTLYDFLAHRAIDFFANSESGLTETVKKFEIRDDVYFGTSEVFIKIPVSTTDTFSLKFYAIKLFQDVVSFHIADKDPQALIDVELKRLKFIQTNSLSPIKDSLYLSAIIAFEKKFPDSPYSTDITYEIANQYYTNGAKFVPLSNDEHKWDIKTAFLYCDQAIKRFPNSDGAKNCIYLQDQILNGELTLTVEAANVPGNPFKTLVNYKNTPEIYVRVVKLDPDKNRKLLEKSYGEDLVKEYLSMSPDTTWSVKLPDDGDYQRHSAEIKIPALKAGLYLILTSNNKNFNYEDKLVSWASCWVTNISFISRQKEKGAIDFYVLNRTTGEPMRNVKVDTYTRDYSYTTRKYEYNKYKSFTTDSIGYFEVPANESKNYDYRYFYADFMLGNDKFSSNSYFYQYPYYPPDDKPELITFFFLDRAIYRPGQTIYFKGIILQKDGVKYQIKPNQSTTVELYDANYQKVTSLYLVSNEYGSFDGTFTAPSNGLTGQMYLTDTHGTVYFSVEEYKRPKFEVTFEPIKGTYKLGDKVTVTGLAKAYAGNVIDGAQVKFRVVRNGRFPYWGYWWGWYCPSSPQMEIMNGDLVTDDEGHFKVEFSAIPDLSIAQSYKPVFDYTVYADVTDINGETHSSQIYVSVGYTALLVSVNVPSTVDRKIKNEFNIFTTNFSGETEHSDVNIKISSLQQPDRVLRERQWTQPDKYTMTKEEYASAFPMDVYADETSIYKWAVDKQYLDLDLNTAKDSILKPEMTKWPSGIYMLIISAKDKYGTPVEARSYFTVYAEDDKQIPTMSASWFATQKGYGEPGEKASYLFGTQKKDLHVLYEIEQNGQIIQKEWLKMSDEMRKFEIPLLEKYRGNISLHMTYVKDNRYMQQDELISVPFTNKQLDIKFETFRDKLLPGQQEQWKLIIKGMNGDKVAAEMVATLYDASLDAFRANSWYFNILNYSWSSLSWNASNAFTYRTSESFMKPVRERPNMSYRYYDYLNWFGFNFYNNYYTYSYRYAPGLCTGSAANMEEGAVDKMTRDESPASPPKAEAGEKLVADVTTVSNVTEIGGKDANMLPSENQNNGQGGGVQVRKNFNETAFFFPHLMTNDKGEVIIDFTVPEALTRWKMMGFAHTKDLKFGQISEELVTQKDLMVVPNPPRFFREGDKIFFSAKISNVSDKDLAGEATLEFFDATTMKPIDALMNNVRLTQAFTLEKGKSNAISWEVSIPDGIGAITYRIVAKAGNFSDGEEMAIPVLTNRMLVTETQPLPINGNQTKNFTFTKLVNSGSSSTLRNFKLTLEFTSNPAWYAIQALPYLMEYPYECSEQTFNRFYANSIASYVANSSPRIKQVFDSWKNFTPDALLSNLEKNQELKSLMLEETPWVLEAKDESERKHRVALLFDLNTMANELDRAMIKLQKKQTSNGGWSWFDGMPDDRYITQYIITGFGHLDHLGIKNVRENNKTWDMVSRGVKYLDDRIREDYEDIKRWYPKEMDKNHIGYTQIQYLYARSYFRDIPVENSNKEAFDYFKGQAAKYWNDFGRYMQGMIALGLSRYEDKVTPADIIKSLKEKALHNEEMGMYWADMQGGYYWYQAPIETMALMIECFDEVANDQKAVEELKIWLLKQKQTQDWKTTKATAEACYALLLKGADALASDKLVEIKMGDQVIDPKKMDDVKVEAGTGYFKTSWSGSDIKPEMGNITVTKTDDGVAWGAVYWQYFEQLDKITPAETPLKLDKKLFRVTNSETGPILEPITPNTILKVGDKIKVRIELRVDRDMEYVHMKDMRASGFEPTNVMSQYKYQDGLGYYESTRDAATNFFFNWLPKGTYVFEYPMFVTHDGDFSNGVTTIQCMYAPEFTSHSEGIRVKVVE